MKHLYILLILLIGTASNAQNIVVDSQGFTPQQLIEEVLVDSNCIDNVVVTNFVGGDFNGTDESYGFFDATGTTFPFENGVVLSTGRLNNTQGPNSSLSDDDAPGWGGDQELEAALNESNTTNATILEFDFETPASEISFRYIFASEEYQEGDANTCRFSDLFGFLIRPIGDQNYTNIALVPDTMTPVKVTTVHPEIPGGCAAENEFYFDQFNGTTAPINFNGQTAILTATATLIPNTVYHVKLVIADEQNFRFDSAVFLEGGSLQLSKDLGPDLLVSTASALCPDDEITLNASEPGLNDYTWFKDGVLLNGATASTLQVTDAGVYTVTIALENGCEAFGEITVEYGDAPVVSNASLQQCALDSSGSTFFDLTTVAQVLVNGNNDLVINGYYTSSVFATGAVNAINDPSLYQNTNISEIVFVRIENDLGCFTIAEIALTVATNTLAIPIQQQCDEDGVIDGIITFNLNSVAAVIETQISVPSQISFYTNELDALFEENRVGLSFENTVPNTQTIFARADTDMGCYAITPIALEVLNPPSVPEDISVVYCLNTFPEAIILESGVTSNAFEYRWAFNGNPLIETASSLAVNEVGNYTVTVVAANGCSADRTFTVTASDLAVITDVIIDKTGTTNTVTIVTEGLGVYEYALDTQLVGFGDSSVFNQVPAGFHTVFIRDRNGCGITIQRIAVLGFPAYFSPNNDGINDVWKVSGANLTENPISEFTIFDRFGKILHSQRNEVGTWDGTYNGELLPPNGYWYRVTLEDGRTFTGALALVL